MMGPWLRKVALTAHVTASVGWVGAVAVFLALAVAGWTSTDPQVVRGAYLAMAVSVWWVIVPAAFATLLTGLVSSLGTSWGLLRHYWVLIKLLIVVFATAVLLGQLASFDQLAQAAAAGPLPDEALRAQQSAIVHSVGGLVVLLVALVLAVFKPKGVTPFGARRQRRAG